MNLNWAPVVPAGWILIMVLAAAVALGAGLLVLRRKGIAPRWVAGLAALRIVIIGLFALCLAGPVLTVTTPTQRRPLLMLLVDVAGGPETPDADAPAPPSTGMDALAWMQRQGLIDAARANYDLLGFAIHHDAEPMPLEHITDATARTDATAFYARGLRSAWNHLRVGPAGRGLDRLPPVRAVLMSDGHDADPEDVVAVARELGITIDTLAPAEPAPPRKTDAVVINGLYAPARVRLGAEARFLVDLRRDAGAPDQTILRLDEDGETVLERPVRFDGQTDKPILLAWRPQRAGIRQYRLHTAEHDDPADEPADADDGFRFHLRVESQRHEVLMIEDSWRWDFKFLRRILEDDPLFALTAFLARGAGAFVQFSDPDRRIRLTGFPRTRAELEGFDLFILGNVQPRLWPRTLAPALRELVVEGGKSMIILAGPDIDQLAAMPDLAGLLPVELGPESAQPRPGPVAVAVSLDGRRAPFFFSAGEQTFWDDLPPVDRIYAPVRKKPAATVLVQAAEWSNPYGNLIVAAEHTVGRGRVLYIGTDTLWKWQMRGEQNEEGKTPYALFWQQALRAMAGGHGAQGGVALNLRPDRARAVPGQRMILHAAIESDAPLALPEIEGRIVLPDGRQRPLLFKPDPDHPSRFQADVLPETTGRHAVTATLFSEKTVVTEALAAFDVAPSPPIDGATGSQEANLRRIAAQTGGRFIQRDDPQTWPTTDTPEPVRLERRRILDFWHTFLLPALLVSVMGADWLLRLVKGFV